MLAAYTKGGSEGTCMARNKYPEVTVERILDVSQRLFLEKGYDHTTIQDIVDELGGLTKGAVYHHFRSKEEILDAVSDRMFFANNPFESVKKRTDLSGLEKLREAVRLNQQDTERARLTAQAIPITHVTEAKHIAHQESQDNLHRDFYDQPCGAVTLHTHDQQTGCVQSRRHHDDLPARPGESAGRHHKIHGGSCLYMPVNACSHDARQK